MGKRNVCLDFMSIRFFTSNEIRGGDKNLSKGLGNKKQRDKVAQAKGMMPEYLNR